jgi:hypothetical protein
MRKFNFSCVRVNSVVGNKIIENVPSSPISDLSPISNFLISVPDFLWKTGLGSAVPDV